jgi:hypothetical protein
MRLRSALGSMTMVAGLVGSTLLPATAQATTPDETAQTASPRQTGQNLGQFTNGSKTFTVTVREAGAYEVQYLVSYPESASCISTSVDGRALPIVAVPAEPGSFGAVASTEPFELTAGRHTITVSSSDLPSQIGASATLYQR